MNIDIQSIKKLITKKTKAIVFVNYGGLPCDLNELNAIAKKRKIVLIQDAAQSLGAKYNNNSIVKYADYTIYSFQAIKQITSGDGGMLVFKDKKKLKKAYRIRWFGIDRLAKQGGTWENDIKEIGFKYQMTDIGASLLLESIKDFKKIWSHRRKLYKIYETILSKNSSITIMDKKKSGTQHSNWLFTICLKRKDYLQKKLRQNGVETNQVHFRNDRYSIFKSFIKGKKFKNMDLVENNYLVLPIHPKVKLSDAKRISNLIMKIIN